MRDYKNMVKYLVKKFNTRNPHIIADELGITVKLKELSPAAPKGCFKKVLKRKFIIVNTTRIINDTELNMVLAHELGHALLHCSDSDFFLHDNTFFNRGKYETEANLFAAELLIDENKIDKIYLRNCTLEQIALHYEVSTELVSYKYNSNH